VVTIRVALKESRDASYDILVGPGLLGTLPALLAERAPSPFYVVIADSHVAELYGKKAVAALQSGKLRAQLFTFAAGEWNKTRETWAALTDQMLKAHVGRDGVVIALGGGVTGDVAGFVAATYHRGIACVQVPTSLLAMVDSSIGGKTGVDTATGKNLLGAFHQPRLVVADTDLLQTLPRPQLAAGLAEAVKHGVVADAAYFALVVDNASKMLAKDPGLLAQAVARSVEIKAAVVAEDERESGKRAVLNFGHTIGHAVETKAGFGVLHGEAVAIGMRYEADLAEKLGIGERGLGSAIRSALEALSLPVQRPDSDPVDQLLEIMQGDKKARDGAVRFALPERVGRMHQDPKHGWTVPVAESAVRDVIGS
jgi:3-dehydroquinate synthase